MQIYYIRLYVLVQDTKGRQDEDTIKVYLMLQFVVSVKRLNSKFTDKKQFIQCVCALLGWRATE